MEKARLSDIANLAGVSKAAAGKVLNGGRAQIRVGAEARKRILEAARQLNYQPNMAASILAGGSSKLIGVLIDSRAPESMYGILAEIELAADALGYRILTAQAHDNPEKLMQSYYALKQNGVDGIISFSHDYSHLGCRLDQRLKDDHKIVFVLNTDEENTSAVDVDFRSGMSIALEHLRSRGYRKTALVLSGSGSRNNLPLSCRNRLDGFQQNCPRKQAFLLNSPSIDVCRLGEECRRLVQEALIPEKYDSALVMNDLFAFVLMDALTEAGLDIPADFGVVGCDNHPIGACYPVKLTTLNYDRIKIARSALQVLLEKIAGNSDPVRMIFPMELVVRESTNKITDIISSRKGKNHD